MCVGDKRTPATCESTLYAFHMQLNFHLTVRTI